MIVVQSHSVRLRGKDVISLRSVVGKCWRIPQEAQPWKLGSIAHLGGRAVLAREPAAAQRVYLEPKLTRVKWRREEAQGMANSGSFGRQGINFQ